MMVVNQSASAMLWGTYAKLPEHTGRVVNRQVNYTVINRPVSVERPVTVDKTTELAIENQFEIYI